MDSTNELQIINEESIKEMIYEIKGQKVMLDFDLARIYGYETKNFNRQVKNNIDKFPKDFMFQITREESELLVRCKNFTSLDLKYFKGKDGGTRYLPYAFSEKGIYMLMTVLRGELAVKQSIALIRLFQSMKDYIVTNKNMITTNETLKLVRQVSENTLAIEELRETIEPVINSFNETYTFNDHFLIKDGQRIEADIAYQQIFISAKHSIIIIDDYISLKTFHLLKCCGKGVSITIFSDNVATNKITESDIADFINDTGNTLLLKPTSNRIHDRYIIIDYKAKNECIYHAGSSSKDSGNKITTITKIEYPSGYYQIIDGLLK